MTLSPSFSCQGRKIPLPSSRDQQISGEVAEWSIASVLKTEDGKPSVGSNPTLSALTPIQLNWVGVMAFEGVEREPCPGAMGLNGFLQSQQGAEGGDYGSEGCPHLCLWGRRRLWQAREGDPH